MVADSDGQLAPLRRERVRAVSVARTRTKRGLNAVNAGACTELEELATDGKFSRDKVIAVNPSIEEFLDHGVEWVVIRNEILKGCPNLP
eukprot:105569-Pyramimonas_sp.AAC.1